MIAIHVTVREFQRTRRDAAEQDPQCDQQVAGIYLAVRCPERCQIRVGEGGIAGRICRI